LFISATALYFPESEILMLENLTEIGWDGVDWIDMAQDRDQWRALVNTVLNLQVP
jgi:hypothetical protein